jgi:hypothetical protein
MEYERERVPNFQPYEEAKQPSPLTLYFNIFSYLTLKFEFIKFKCKYDVAIRHYLLLSASPY